MSLGRAIVTLYDFYRYTTKTLLSQPDPFSCTSFLLAPYYYSQPPRRPPLAYF